MVHEEGLRERKRRRTRAAIADAAMGLFMAHGFDQVSRAQIAGAAEVATKTVYNYFPIKADLFFDEGDALLVELLTALRTRGPDESALSAVRGFVAGLGEWAAHRRPVRPTPEFRALIEASPSLKDGQRRMFAHYETALAEQLAAETGAAPGSVEPFVAAVALVAVLRAPFDAPTGGAEAAHHDARAALDRLEAGLGDYAVGTTA